MRPIRLLTVIALAAVLFAGCGGGDDSKGTERNGKVRQTDTGIRIINAVDAETGLALEFQDDGLYLKLTGDTPGKVRDRIKGKDLAGVCKAEPGKAAPGLSPAFQIFWRDDFGDWGSALVRNPERKPPLADVLKGCRIYAGEPGSSQIRTGPSAKPVAEINLR